ncbi:hypothetical protein H8S95_10795 [Pontibacter sp. KCTC 32443]|uniref:hypothetical protein n=1 Tax=Pontibacter TaxID=323449 RepID=UPI00164CE52C|nr:MULTISPECIES: hypothetical protein [Pontibacter]MBC5774548.1 hypothetical protein [Pontibacter sp. KCTC 32443]
MGYLAETSNLMKISKSNLKLWMVYFPTLLIIAHIFVGSVWLYISISSKLYFLFLPYAVIAFVHFFMAKILRYYKLKEVYLAEAERKLVVINLATTKKISINLDDITKVKMSFGVVEIETQYKEKIYTLPYSKWEFNYLKAVAGL